ncbi:hypothetical protein [Butyrivibrio sp. INlla14]|uniref:hypothetical protein n=1 Tax=Butyrivibrio sp. INlla14 TaxID=1520808 RepID=UPI0008765731|nr:hypothetical protein [Butyrivibrio sp. INlla14]SCY62781.1 hypothetical protein SAMN02910371_03090 [Butyrivibrio sp. INlla14]
MATLEGEQQSCLAFCPKCGAFLMEAVSTSSSMPCPECGEPLVISVKNSKVSVFEDKRFKADADQERVARLKAYYSVKNRCKN